MDDIAIRPEINGHRHRPDVERCPYCGERHPARRPDTNLRYCGGLLRHRARWRIVYVGPQREAVAA